MTAQEVPALQLDREEGGMMTGPKDEQLMAQVAEGDLDAFNEIVLRHQHTAWRIACRFLGDASQTEDVVQEAFLRILTAAPRYKPGAKFSTYLYRVVSNLCIDHARKKRPVSTDTLPESADRSPDPLAALGREERDDLVRQALDTLPSRQRMVVVLKYYEGLRYDEIARAMGTTVKAVERLSLLRISENPFRHLPGPPCRRIGAHRGITG